MSSHLTTHHITSFQQLTLLGHTQPKQKWVNPSYFSVPLTKVFTWAVEQYVVILYMAQSFLQPVKVVGEVLHAEDQASVWAKSERMVLHHVIHLDELTDV